MLDGRPGYLALLGLDKWLLNYCMVTKGLTCSAIAIPGLGNHVSFRVRIHTIKRWEGSE